VKLGFVVIFVNGQCSGGHTQFHFIMYEKCIQSFCREYTREEATLSSCRGVDNIEHSF
jgi:hypothetical protein